MKLLSSILAAFVLASAVYAFAQPTLRPQAQPPLANAPSIDCIAQGKQKGGGEVIQGGLQTRQQTWQSRNFQLEPAPKQDGINVKQSSVTDSIGQERDYQREPGKLEFPAAKGAETSTTTSTTTTTTRCP